MKELMLWRHAKSSRARPELEDFQRPLNNRGKRSAEAVGRWLATRHLAPDHVLASSSVRTSQTAEQLLAQFPQKLAITFERTLYLAEAEQLLRRLQQLPANVGRAMLIGHNEGIWDLAVQLAQVGPVDQLASLHEKLPTGALAWLRFAIDEWRDLAVSQGELVHFLRPRDIMDEAR